MIRSGRGSKNTTATGHRAEDAALRYLKARRLELVARNFRCRGGEIDLIMLDGATLVIVEVRYRCRADDIDPAATITARKRRHLLLAAEHFLQRHANFADHALRFDVMALSGAPDAPSCRWIRGAFDSNDSR